MKKIQILGPFNTGTNLSTKVLNHISTCNIDHERQIHIWKHTILKDNLEECIINNKNTLFICMYKPIYHWIESIKKSSYNITWNKDIYSKCTFKDKSKNIFEYKNIVELYNSYYLTYKYLIEKYNNVIWIDYYKLLDKENVEKYIKDKLSSFNIKDKENNINDILNKPSKIHGNPVNNSEEALKKKIEIDNNYENSEDKKFIDNILDKSIVDFYR